MYLRISNRGSIPLGSTKKENAPSKGAFSFFSCIPGIEPT